MADKTSKAKKPTKKDAPVKETAVKETPVQIASTKDTTKQISTKAGVMVDPEPKKAVAKEPTKEAVAPKKGAAKKVEIKSSFAIQYLDTSREWDEKDLLKQVKEIWTKTYKRKVAEIKTIKYYIKQEEHTVYFVVNGEVSDKIYL